MEKGLITEKPEHSILNENISIHREDHNVVITLSSGPPIRLTPEETKLLAAGTIPAGLNEKLTAAEISALLEFIKPDTDHLKPENWFTDEKETAFKPYLCASDYLRVFPHVVTEYKGTIHQFTGRCWLKDASGLVATTIEEAGRGTIKPRQISEAIESLRNLTRIKDPEKLDLPMEKIMPMPKHSVPIENGILDMMQKKIAPFSPRYFYTEVLPRNYIPGAVPAVFIEFLDKVFQGDPNGELKKAQLFETIAWTLKLDYSLQGAVILYGQGGEGKSILHKVFEEVLGHVTTITLRELEQDKYKRAELYGSWANLISESSGEIVISEWFKRLTDGTTITAERKNERPFQFASHAKMILDVNELPNEEGQLRAFYRRVALIVDFPNMLEEVMSPQEIDEYVRKLRETEELDRIFSYVVDNFYGPLVQRMKFTGHLSIAEAEKKWEERSNPAQSYIQMKKESGNIHTDVEYVKVLLQNNYDRLKRYVTREKSGTEYLTMVKEDVIRDAQKWATERGFPTKTIDSRSLGRGLNSVGYNVETIHKKISAGTVLRAWKDVYIDISDGGEVAHPQNPLLPPQKQSRIDGTELSGGSILIPDACESKINIERESGSECYQISKTLENTKKNQVAPEIADVLPDPLPRRSEAPSDPVKSSVQSETAYEQPPITLEDGNLIRVQLLSLGYHLDPDCGPNIDWKYYKIGIHGLRSLPDDKQERLHHIMEREHFKPFNQGVFGVHWFVRPLGRDCA
jgi:P4 family phage/plasmid primase-like protien